MQVLKSAVVTLFAVIALSGCSTSSTKQFVPLPDQTKRLDDPGKARLYVLRVSKLKPIDVGKVRDGDALVGSLGPDAYLCWEREPGEALLRSSWSALGTAESKADVYELRLSVTAGSVYYIMQQWRCRGSDTPTRLAVLNEDYGKKKLAGCKLPTVTTK